MRPFLKIHTLGLLALIIKFFAFPTAATTYYVDINSPNPTPPYNSWTTAATNIQNALSQTANGDLVLVNPGIYQSGGYTAPRTNLAKGGVASRVAMTLMRHSDRRLTNKIYTDENLLGTWSAFDALPNYTASQGASQKLVAVSQNGSSGVTMGDGSKAEKSIVDIGKSHIVALDVTSGHNAGNGGSGGARTRNLCRDRAAL